MGRVGTVTLQSISFLFSSSDTSFAQRQEFLFNHLIFLRRTYLLEVLNSTGKYSWTFRYRTTVFREILHPKTASVALPNIFTAQESETFIQLSYFTACKWESLFFFQTRHD